MTVKTVEVTLQEIASVTYSLTVDIPDNATTADAEQLAETAYHDAGMCDLTDCGTIYHSSEIILIEIEE